MKRLLAVLRLIIFIILAGLVIFFIYRLVINVRARNSKDDQISDSAYQQVDEISSSTNISGENKDPNSSSEQKDSSASSNNSDTSSNDSSNSSDSSDASSSSSSASEGDSAASGSSNDSNSSASGSDASSDGVDYGSKASSTSSASPETGLPAIGFAALSLILSFSAYLIVFRLTKV